jgi:hypothetical protein
MAGLARKVLFTLLQGQVEGEARADIIHDGPRRQRRDESRVDGGEGKELPIRAEGHGINRILLSEPGYLLSRDALKHPHRPVAPGK